MKRAVPILAGLLLMTVSVNAGQCPDKEALMKGLKAYVDVKNVPAKVQLARWLPYVDSLKTCSGADDSVVAYLYRKIASLYKDDEDFHNALKYYPRFLDITRANLGKPNYLPVDMMNVYYWYAYVFQQLNLKKERLMALDSCIAYSQKYVLYNRASLSALYQKTEYYFDQGDYYRSIDYATLCETAARECQKSTDRLLQSDGTRYHSSSYAWKINVMMQLGKLDEAEKYILTKIRETEEDKSTFNLGTLHAQLAEVKIRKGDFSNAVSLFNTALQLEQSKKKYFTCKQIMNTLGRELYFDVYHDDQKALLSFRKALQYINNNEALELSDQIESLNIYTNIAEIFVGRNQFDSAFHYFQMAFEQIMPGASEQQFLAIGRPELLQQKKIYYITNLMIAKGDASQKRFQISGNRQFLEDAIRVYRVTDQFLDLLRKEQTELESKLFWRKDTRRLYEHAINACYISKNEADAFYFFERSRAALLNDQLTHQRWAGDKEIRQEIQLSKKLVQLQRSLDTTAQTSEKYDGLVRDKLRLTNELAKIREQLKSDNPLYYHNLQDTGSLSISRARNLILPGYSALVENFNGDSAVFIMIITNGESILKKLDKAKYIGLVNEFTALLSDHGALNSGYQKFIMRSGDLYSLIFEGVFIPAGRIIVSPDGPNLPYEALVKSKVGEPLKYMVEDYAISYTYSMQFLEGIQGNHTTTSPGDFYGLAPVLFNPSFHLVSLTGSDQSLKRIDQLFRNSSMFIGKEATANKFRDFYRYQVVQLYTHASDSGMFSEPVIYLGDSSLNLSDIVYEERPSTRLIVLSACETALGKNYQGEGVFSFSRGFAALGIPSSISNLWSVENESTYLLTELFYKYLAEGLPLDISLQKAKLEFLQAAGREKQLPYFWAAQVLYGRTDPVSIRKPVPLPIILTGIIAGFFALSLTWIWYRRKKAIPTQGRAESVS